MITKKLYLVCILYASIEICLARPQGRPKKKKKLTNNLPKAPKPKAEPGHYIVTNVLIFCPFSHAINKGFPNSD